MLDLKGSHDESAGTIMEALCPIRGRKPTLSLDRVYPSVVAGSVYYCFTLSLLRLLVSGHLSPTADDSRCLEAWGEASTLFK